MKHPSSPSFYILLSALLIISHLSDALLAPSSLRSTAPHYYSRSRCVRLSNNNNNCSRSKPRKHVSRIVLHSSSDEINGTASSSNVAQKTQIPAEIPASLTITTGVLTSLLGYMYSQCMKRGFRLLWKTFPSFLFGSTTGAAPSNPLVKYLTKHPPLYIIGMTTLGGSTVAYLSSYFEKMYSAHDYVHILSGDEGSEAGKVDEDDVFPSAMYIFPVMGMCLLTSLSGFSLGPEAPMVTVGSLAGASLARKYYNHQNSQVPSPETTIPSKSSLEKVLAYAGAAGSLTGFMNIPLAGPIFALEMTSRHVSVATSAVESWSTSILASLAGIAFIRGILVPNMGVGGHFDYISRAAVGAVNGREMALVGLGCGLAGALVGTAFHTVTRFLKRLMWSGKKMVPIESTKRDKYVGILKKACVALAIGLLSTFYPQTMFWGEGSLQCMVSGQCTPFVSTPHGLPMSMLQWARVNPNTPLASLFDALQVGFAKFFAIALASAGKYPGGVIFPLLSNGAGLSQALIAGVSKLIPGFSNSLASPMMVMSFMAATLTSITRTPLATCLILALTASNITPLSVMLPGALMASYVSVYASEKLSEESFFEYCD